MNRITFLKVALGAALVVPLIASGTNWYDSERCKGMTKQNAQCKNTTKSESGLCWLHDPNYVKNTETKSVVCSDTTKIGNPCKVKTKHESGICHHHRD